MFCIKCGAKNSDNANFCCNCGEKMFAVKQTSTHNSTDINSFSTNNYQQQQTNNYQQERTTNYLPKQTTNYQQGQPNSYQQRQTTNYQQGQPNNYQQRQTNIYQQRQTNNYSAPRQVQRPAVNTYHNSPIRHAPQTMNSNVKTFYIITLLFHALSIILFFVPSLFSSASFSDSLEREEISSMFELFTAMSFGVAFIIIVIKIASAILTSLPLFNNGKMTSMIIISKIITSLELLWLLLCIVILVSEANTRAQRYSELDIEASAGLTVGGYLYLASLLTLLVFLFITSAKTKKK